MQKARDLKTKAQREAEKKPGSGNLWKRKRTVPRGPRLRVDSHSRDRERSQRRSWDSLGRIISMNNLSIKDIDLYNDYDSAPHK